MTAMHNTAVFLSSVPVRQAYAPRPSLAPFYSRLLAYLEAYAKPCSFNQLASNFAHQVGGVLPAKNLRCRLNYLVSTGLVEVKGTRSHYQYQRTTMPVPDVALAPTLAPRGAATALPGAGRPKVQATQPGPPPQAVQAPRHNRLEGVYVAPRAPGLRPGALDYARVPSRGVAC
nr:hypothetical protein [uncultured Albidiferax sp.]